ELLRQIGVQFEARAAAIAEVQADGEAPDAYVRRLAAEKAAAVWARVAPAERRPVLGADTAVVLGLRVLGKPVDAAEAEAMLAALVAGRVLQEVLIERRSRRGLISNIYKGKVSRVLPGMQAAFVELGLERTAFLHASDVVRSALARDGDDPAAAVREADIRDVVQEGQELLVQILKEPLGTKGARL